MVRLGLGLSFGQSRGSARLEQIWALDADPTDRIKGEGLTGVFVGERGSRWPELTDLDDEIAPVVAWFRGDDDGTQLDGARQMETRAPSGASLSGGPTRTEGLPNPGELQLDGAVSAQQIGRASCRERVCLYV